MTKGREAVSLSVAAERTQFCLRKRSSPENEVSSRPERSAVEGPAVFSATIRFLMETLPSPLSSRPERSGVEGSAVQRTLIGNFCPCRKPRGGPHPRFPVKFSGSAQPYAPIFKKGAHAVLSSAAYRKFGASRSFVARCGIPRLSTFSLIDQKAFRLDTPVSLSRQPVPQSLDPVMRHQNMPLLPQQYLPQRQGKILASERLLISTLSFILAFFRRSQQRMISAA
jgi:hypothetical protein